MPYCTIKFSKAAAARKPKVVRDAGQAIHVLEASDDVGDVEIWEGSNKLCSVEALGPGFWRVKR